MTGSANANALRSLEATRRDFEALAATRPRLLHAFVEAPDQAQPILPEGAVHI